MVYLAPAHERRTTYYALLLYLQLDELTLIVLSYDALITIELDRNRKLQTPRCKQITKTHKLAAH